MRSFIALFLGGLAALAAASGRIASFAEVKTILAAQGPEAPPELRNADAAKWSAWVGKQNAAIRTRLEQGDLDSMVHLLLFGVSFTTQPRVTTADLAEAARSGRLRTRVDDMVTGLRNPGGDERLLFVRGLLERNRIDIQTQAATQFLYDNLLRVLKEQRELAARAEDARTRNATVSASALLDRESIFATRGVSLDTSILPNYAIEQALRDLLSRGVLHKKQIARVAVIGPGLDFVDKNEDTAYDYYPPQTLQPFALFDSLLGLDLAAGSKLSMSILDVSPRVLDHVQRAHDHARDGYTIQLPLDSRLPWPQPLLEYWSHFGDRIATGVPPLTPPAAFPSVLKRAVRIRPEILLATQAYDVNIVVERLSLPERDRFELIVGTNIFVYYDAFQQALALENIGAMLKPGGLLLTNDRLPVVQGGKMREAGVSEVHYDAAGTREAIGWYLRN